MEVRARKLVLYQTANGKCPWQDWFSELKDRRGKAAIDARLQRVQRGHLGDFKPVGSGVFELRVHVGPGYRIYAAEDGDTFVVLLCGGSKGSQRRDIARARAYWNDYRS